MNTSINDLKVEVSLENDDKGQNLVRVVLSNQTYQGCFMTPAQARVLATELIQAVHKAEVRHKLQASHNTAWHVSKTMV